MSTLFTEPVVKVRMVRVPDAVYGHGAMWGVWLFQELLAGFCTKRAARMHAFHVADPIGASVTILGLDGQEEREWP